MATQYRDMDLWFKSGGMEFYKIRDPMDPAIYWTSSEPEHTHRETNKGPTRTSAVTTLAKKKRARKKGVVHHSSQQFKGPQLRTKSNSGRGSLAEVALIASTFGYKQSFQFRIKKQINSMIGELSEALTYAGGLLLVARIQMDKHTNPDSGMRVGYFRDMYISDSGDNVEDVYKDTPAPAPLTGREAKGFHRDPNNAVMSAQKFPRPPVLKMPSGFQEEHCVIWVKRPKRMPNVKQKRELKDVPAQMGPARRW